MIEAVAKIFQEVAKEGLANRSSFLPEFAKDWKPKEITSYSLADKPLGKMEGLDKVDLSELSKQYTEALKEVSPYPETIGEQNLNNWEKVSPEEVADKRMEFRNFKESLIEQWEQLNGKEWPKYEEDVYSNNGIKIRSAGDYYDAHHLQSLECGGANTAENITPLHAKDHYDRQGIHSPTGVYQKISDALGA